MVMYQNIVFFVTNAKSHNIIPNWADFDEPVVPLSSIDFEDDEIVINTFSYDLSKQNLEQLILLRSPSSSLANRNILKGNSLFSHFCLSSSAENIAPSLAATQQIIKFKLLSDVLEHKLERRPSLDDLMSTNILKAPLYVSSLLQSLQQQIKFNQTIIQVDHKLYHRPTRTALITLNIIRGEVAPSLHAVQQSLKFRKTKSSLDHKLEIRPKAIYLVQQNILKEHHAMLSSNIQAAQQVINRPLGNSKICQSLKFHVAQATLDHKLKENRPKKEFSMFEFTEAASNLKHKLETRVSLNKLLGDGILQGNYFPPR
jgi:hypothetical protein